MKTQDIIGGLLADGINVLLEPLDSLVQGNIEGRELELRVQAHELLVGGSLLVLTIGLGGIETVIASVTHGLDNGVSDLLDRDLLLLRDCKG
jgi:hypothetical protein